MNDSKEQVRSLASSPAGDREKASSRSVHQAVPGGDVASPLTVVAPLVNAPLAAGPWPTYGTDHIFRGGDGITNFAPEQLPIYAEAIQRHGDPDLYIGPPMHPYASGLALRRHGGFPKDGMGPFWDVVHAVREGPSASGAVPSAAPTVNPARQESRPDDTQPAGSLPALQSKEKQ